MNPEGLRNLVYEAFETEKNGVIIYETAIRCAVDDELTDEWEKFLEQTRRHVEIVRGVMVKLGFDSRKEVSGQQALRIKAEAMVEAMETALQGGDREKAQLIAAECIVDAETKDHMNWELLGEAAEEADGAQARALKDAFDEVEDEEDEHLDHAIGWVRDLWVRRLGLPARVAAERAKRSRGAMMNGGRRSRQPAKTHVAKSR